MRLVLKREIWHDSLCTATHLRTIDAHAHQFLNPLRPNPGRREKINLNFYFHTSLWCLKSFYEGLIIKPFEAAQRSVKINI